MFSIHVVRTSEISSIVEVTVRKSSGKEVVPSAGCVLVAIGIATMSVIGGWVKLKLMPELDDLGTVRVSSCVVVMVVGALAFLRVCVTIFITVERGGQTVPVPVPYWLRRWRMPVPMVVVVEFFPGCPTVCQDFSSKVLDASDGGRPVPVQVRVTVLGRLTIMVTTPMYFRVEVGTVAPVPVKVGTMRSVWRAGFPVVFVGKKLVCVAMGTGSSENVVMVEVTVTVNVALGK
jgi:hypothetical protein